MGNRINHPGHGNRAHGESGKNATPEYRAWKGMHERCTNVRGPNYPNYGERGIKVCKRWDVYKNFLADMGRKPSPTHSLHRVNNDSNYEPSNCKWALTKEQNNARRPHRKHKYKRFREARQLRLRAWEIAPAALSFGS
jgi:hypothetical protein